MSSIYGENIHISIFGQSHSAAIGVAIDGIPAGLAIDTAALNAFMRRRDRTNIQPQGAKRTSRSSFPALRTGIPAARR